jgi:hypothetical protein
MTNKEFDNRAGVDGFWIADQQNEIYQLSIVNIGQLHETKHQNIDIHGISGINVGWNDRLDNVSTLQELTLEENPAMPAFLRTRSDEVADYINIESSELRTSFETSPQAWLDNVQPDGYTPREIAMALLV